MLNDPINRVGLVQSGSHHINIYRVDMLLFDNRVLNESVEYIHFGLFNYCSPIYHDRFVLLSREKVYYG
jgi:hypothetical protein